MRAFLQAVLLLVLLLGFYVMTLGLLAAIVAADVVLTDVALRQGYVTFLFLGISVAFASPLVSGLFASVRGVNRHRPDGIRVTAQEQPELWARVRRVAEAMETSAPVELWLVAEPVAAVWQSSWVLGLIPGPRRMVLGIPFLTGLTERQIDAVIAHELGHFAQRHTVLAGLAARNRVGLMRVLERYAEDGNGIGHAMGSMFAGYARFCLRTTQAQARLGELAADRAAAGIAGRDTTAAALRRIPLLDAAHTRYVREYAGIGTALGLLPPAQEVHSGFRAFLDSGTWQEEERRLIDDPPREKTSPYDSHPPMRERVAAIEALPADAAGTFPGEPSPAGTGLVRDLAGTGARTVLALPGAAELRQLPWRDLAAEVGTAELGTEATPVLRAGRAVLRRTADLAMLLDAVDAGQWAEVVDCMPRPGHGGHMLLDDSLRARARADAVDALYSLVLTALVEGGRARWELDWERGRHLEFDEGVHAALDRAMDAAVSPGEGAEPDTSGLRDLLGLPADRAPAQP
ncbi:M48 family metallopeptidase [Actinacidiphila glaucinigra]|uniref:Zn-dependent protease with chaperone function n=1 Tax=Actinacidiphila glaucinigra TaxID=235986 RepID=A0A238ZIS3_9ACTN|nr:M48 family metallopeptidase [Actinacidiphila glaucinigra]SNR83325.1 Zn-dependent protease with chaperone function [Actinacidiphila glaucinigra]